MEPNGPGLTLWDWSAVTWPRPQVSLAGLAPAPSEKGFQSHYIPLETFSHP
jgi:hypothetical protein